MSDVRLRRTRPDDLDAILVLEHRPENRDYIGQWTRDEHVASMASADREHWVVESADGVFHGYLIAFDAREAGFGIYVKRVAVAEPSRGIGRQALAQFLEHVWLDSNGTFVSLAVRAHNARAIRCYTALGFETWELPPAERARMNEQVDTLSDDCLVMKRGQVLNLDIGSPMSGF